MININELKNLVEQDIRQAYIEVINDNQLVDTGALRDTVIVTAGDSLKDLTITLQTQYYYKYLDEGTIYIEPYDLTTQLLNHDLWLKAEDRLGDIVLGIIENTLDGFPTE
jgi:hypothetical protein